MTAPGMRDATDEDINRSANAIIKLAKANGYHPHAYTYNMYDIDRRGGLKDTTTKILTVVLVDNTDLSITVVWRNGAFAYARPANDKFVTFGHMNHTQLRAAITGDWTSYQRCLKCFRWNAPCKCEDE